MDSQLWYECRNYFCMWAGLLLGIDLIISFIAVMSWEGRGKGEHREHGVSRSRREDE